MRQSKLFLFIVLLICILIFGLMGCNWDDRQQNGAATPQPGQVSASNITATFGAEQFHIQLTAIAKEAQTSSTGGAAWP